jgi:hypothetical protein
MDDYEIKIQAKVLEMVKHLREEELKLVFEYVYRIYIKS